MTFKVDTHVHTAEASACGQVSGADMASIYADADYDAMVVCDHYYRHFFEMAPDLGWTDQVERYLSGFHAAREAGEELGLGVFLGIELNLDGGRNDYLIYGLDEAFLRENPKLYRLPLWEVRELMDAVGAAVVQAHPFRPGMARADAALIHGAEVINGHPNQPSENPAALQWALDEGLLMTAGSDAHFREGTLRAHMTFPRELADGADLARAILDAEAVEIAGPDGLRAPCRART